MIIPNAIAFIILSKLSFIVFISPSCVTTTSLMFLTLLKATSASSVKCVTGRLAR